MNETKIQWTDTTWNPVAGCDAVSPGCANCYAARQAGRFAGVKGGKFEGLAVLQPRARWTGKIKLDEKALLEPLKWRKPRRVFVASMGDVFHEDVPDEFIDRIFAVMALCPHLTFQVLTKRPERAAAYLTRRYMPGAICDAAAVMGRYLHTREFKKHELGTYMKLNPVAWPLPNVWLGTSVENEEYADKRIPHLLRCPAALRFLSVEPLLGPVDLTGALLSWYHGGPAGIASVLPPTETGAKAGADFMPSECGHVRRDRVFSVRSFEDAAVFAHFCPGKSAVHRVMPVGDVEDDPDCQVPGHAVQSARAEIVPDGTSIGWVIVGGESGPGARPCDVAWVRSVKGQCRAAGVPVFVKQFGAKPRAEEGIDYERALSIDGAYARGEVAGGRDVTVDGPKRSVTLRVPNVYISESGLMSLRDPKGGDPAEWPEDLRVREFPEATT